ncbi:MAG: glycosyltransferase family 2 protein [Bacteroidales bacterium]|nr:glycosyltransferase family 2 protein [Bacteroidales bacterium]
MNKFSTTSGATQHPLFSVLIANYNNGRYLQEAIDSVLSQTYTNWEVIIVDDGSTDHSPEVYARYQSDPRFHIYYNERNRGCGYTKRRCAELANGDICGFLDADDELLPAALTLHTEAHLANPKIALVFSRSRHYDEEGNAVGECAPIVLEDGETILSHKDKAAWNFSSYSNELYHKTEGISAKLQAGVDQDLYFKLEEVGEVKTIDAFTYKYNHRNDKAITNQTVKLWYWNMVALKDAYLRRGLNPDTEMYEYWERVVASLESDAAYRKELEIRNTTTYRLGRALMTPARLVKKLFSHE